MRLICDPIDLIRQASERGVQLRGDDGHILMRPADRLSTDLAERIAENKYAVLAALDTIPAQVITMLAPIRNPIEREELQVMFDERFAIQMDNGSDTYIAECVAFLELGAELERRYAAARQAVADLPERYRIPMDDSERGVA